MRVGGIWKIRTAGWEHPSWHCFLHSRVCSPLDTRGTRQSELSLLKPSEKSVEIKKRNRGGEKKSLSLPFLPKQVFHVQGLPVWKPFITLAHVDFLQSGNFFGIGVISGADSVAFAAGWPQALAAQGLESVTPGFDQGRGSSSVPTMGVSGKLGCGLNLYLPQKVADSISCKMSFSSTPECSQFKYNLILYLIMVPLASLACLSALITSVELWISC